MDGRPTLSLTMIVKNEAENLPRLARSVEGCWNEWIVVDTGSTDNTVEIAKSLGATVYHFDWINDFSAARNFALSKVKTDYAYWLDGDDELHNKDAFIDFWTNSLKYFDYVLATYNYALDKDKKPVVSFARERIFRMSTKPAFSYFIHEGVRPSPGARIHYCSNWAVNHLRTDEDQAKDKARNLNIFEEKKKAGQLDGRLTFYYGKELFENGQHARAIPILLDSVSMNLEPHDRILALQYACYAIDSESDKLQPQFQGEKRQHSIDLATQALKLAPNRAEFHAIIGDGYLKSGRLVEALPSYAAAKYCLGQPQAGDAFAGAIHSFKPLYQEYPRVQIAKILFNLGRTEEAKKEAKECFELFKSEDARLILEEIERLTPIMDLSIPRTKTEDIVFTCPPQTAYEFDEELYKTKGMGGSETALIEMAKWLKKLTGRRVIVFNMRNSPLVSESGVEYFSTNSLNDYFQKWEPAVHIAWRHNIRVTKAPSYLWCHDLMIPGVENGLHQDKVLSLSPFHRDFLASSQGVPRDRILLTRNGIAPEKWAQIPQKTKNPNKFVYASSPDRGLDRVMHILDIVRQTHPGVELHVYYGLENLYKYGQQELADKLKRMIADRPWVKYRGFTEQKQMYEECQDAVVWCHPNDFIETFQITGLEMIQNGVYPITRRWGAVRDTLAEAEKHGWCRLLDIDSKDPQDQKSWADEVVKAIDTKAWENINPGPGWLEKHAWSSVATEWIQQMGLNPCPVVNFGPVKTFEPEVSL